jgi:hypothetical protein
LDTGDETQPPGHPLDNPGRFVERLSVKIPQQHGFRPGVGGTFNLRDNLSNIPPGIRAGFGLGQPGRPAPTNRQMRIAIPTLSGPAAVADNIKIKKQQLWDAIHQHHQRNLDPTYDKQLKLNELPINAAGLLKKLGSLNKLAENSAVLADLKKAKKESDKGNYAAKTDILRKLLKAFPDEFKTDSENAHVVGLTHKPTNFRIHMPKKALPTKTKEEKQAGGGALAGEVANPEVLAEIVERERAAEAEAQLKEWQTMPDGFRIGDNYNSKEKHLLRTLENKGKPIPRLAFDHAIKSQKKNTWNGWEDERELLHYADREEQQRFDSAAWLRWLRANDTGPPYYDDVPGIIPKPPRPWHEQLLEAVANGIGRNSGIFDPVRAAQEARNSRQANKNKVDLWKRRGKGSGPEFQGVTPPVGFFDPPEPTVTPPRKFYRIPPPEFNDKPPAADKQAAVLAKLAKKVKAKDKKKKMHT